MNGCKVYEIRIKLPNRSQITFRDSWLIIPVKLVALKKTFGLKTENKLYFTHGYNKAANYSINLPCLPPASMYYPDSMSEEDKEKFQKWYEANKSTPFHLAEQLKIYCANDTEILMEALLEMRSLLLKVAEGKDVMRDSSTIASICSKLYKALHLKKNHLAIIPEGGFERNERQSVIALMYIQWREKVDGVTMRHAGNGGEHTVFLRDGTRAKLDAYIPSLNKAIEFHGCYIHGHEKDYRPDDILINKTKASELRERSETRIEAIRQSGVEVEVVWECDVIRELKENKQMAAFFESLPDIGPIDPREAYTGGRTGPTALFAAANEDYEISMADIVSLYPSVNYTASYPVGKPDKIIIPDDFTVHWTKRKDNPYQGLLKVRVIPPAKGQLRLPILPTRVKQQLLFCYCIKCAKLNNTSVCPHSESEKSFTTTVTHLELNEALVNGYTVDRLYRVWHYDNLDSELFKAYVRRFLKIKVQASGWPPEVVTDEQKAAFIQAYKDRFEIEIDPTQVKLNPGMRFIAKICLNSLWFV